MGIFVGIAVDPKPFELLLKGFGDSAVSPKELHLTVAHYGNQYDLDDVVSAAERVAAMTREFPLTYGGIGRFHHVTWIGVGVSYPGSTLLKLREKLMHELPAGDARRKFVPHVTVANQRIADSMVCDMPRIAVTVQVDAITVFDWSADSRQAVASCRLRPVEKGLF